jgi:glycosyltransferase involved in cell wall biosynthesis
VHGLDSIIPDWKRFAKLVTLHDLLPLLTNDQRIGPESFRAMIEERYATAVRNADLIVTVSENTRNDVLEYFKLPEDRVISVYPGADAISDPANAGEQTASVRMKYGIERDFFLFVGSISGRKNTERLVRAYSLSRAPENFDLVLVGPSGYMAEDTITAIGESNSAGKIRVVNYVPDEDLAALYSEAQALLFPTIYEGFGFPILEAMLRNTAVLTSDRGSAPEVAGGHACLVDPFDVESIADGIEKLSDGDPIDTAAARKHAETFTWDRCADELLAIYRSIAIPQS